MKEFDNVFALIDEVSRTVDNLDNFVENMRNVKAEDLGLDSRAGYSLYVNDDCIAVRGAMFDRVLQYYGGFEYVDKQDRMEVGDWVFYMADSSRVAECLDCLYESESSEAEFHVMS